MNYLCNILFKSGNERTCWHSSIAESEEKEIKCHSHPKLQNQFKLSQAPFTVGRPIPSLLPKSENWCYVNKRLPRSSNQSQIQWDGKSLVPESANPFLPAQCTKVKKLHWCTPPIFNQNPPFTVSSSQQIPKAISKRTKRLAGQKCL